MDVLAYVHPSYRPCLASSGNPTPKPYKGKSGRLYFRQVRMCGSHRTSCDLRPMIPVAFWFSRNGWVGWFVFSGVPYLVPIASPCLAVNPIQVNDHVDQFLFFLLLLALLVVVVLHSQLFL